MEALFHLFPAESVAYFRRLYMIGFVIGTTMVVPTVLVLRDTISLNEMWCDGFFRLVHILRLILFISQLPFRIYIYRQLRSALDIPDRAGVVNRLVDVIRGRVWQMSQYVGITHSLMCAALLLFMVVDFAIPGRVLAFAARIILTALSPLISLASTAGHRIDLSMTSSHGRLCSRPDGAAWEFGSVALYGLGVVHVILFIFQFSLSMRMLAQLADPDQMYESVMWRLGTGDDTIEANTSVIVYDPALHSPEVKRAAAAAFAVPKPVLSLAAAAETAIVTTAVSSDAVTTVSSGIVAPIPLSEVESSIAAVKDAAPTLRSRIVLSAQTQGLTSPPSTPHRLAVPASAPARAVTPAPTAELPELPAIADAANEATRAATPLPVAAVAAAAASTLRSESTATSVPAAASAAAVRVLEVCAICQDGYKAGERVRQLRCHHSHNFHVDCIDPWLRKKAVCPLCQSKLQTSGGGSTAAAPAPAPAPAPAAVPAVIGAPAEAAADGDREL